jgi:predicted ester cyclase
MDQQKKNKELIIRYYNAISGESKTPALSKEYINDDELIEHIGFFESVFPNYELFADELTAEGNRVVVRARLKGEHRGSFNGIPPTGRKVELPFAISYVIENDKVVHHWMIADQMALMEQLGVVAVPQE